MRSIQLALILAALLIAGAAQTSEAQHPSYLILRAPVAPQPHHPSYGYYPGYGYDVETRTYSYGWFGAKPRPQWSRHFGYYRNYTEWSAR
ncbi:MAG: hypothetical protein CMJ64_20800 [Planctomycetaceae bacterium]|nr:hypothetical protein [Planctomycetaceae bacterium]